MGTCTSLESALKNINLKDSRGNTPLMHACRFNNKEFATKMLNKLSEEGIVLSEKMDLEIKNNNGETALMIACINGLGCIANALIDMGAQVNVQTSQGITALMWACEHGMDETAVKLIEKGADVTRQHDKFLALDYALKRVFFSRFSRSYCGLQVIVKLIEAGDKVDPSYGTQKHLLLYHLMMYYLNAESESDSPNSPNSPNSPRRPKAKETHQHNKADVDNYICTLLEKGAVYDHTFTPPLVDGPITVSTPMGLACLNNFENTAIKIISLMKVKKMSTQSASLLRTVIYAQRLSRNSSTRLLYHLLDLGAELHKDKYKNYQELLQFSKTYNQDHVILNYISKRIPADLPLINAIMQTIIQDRMQLEINSLHAKINVLEMRGSGGA